MMKDCVQSMHSYTFTGFPIVDHCKICSEFLAGAQNVSSIDLPLIYQSCRGVSHSLTAQGTQFWEVSVLKTSGMALKSSKCFSPLASPVQSKFVSRPIILCQARRKDLEDTQEPQTFRQIGDTLLKISSLGLASSVIAQPAGAWGQTWRPRRHHRRLDEWEREPDLGKYSPVSLSSFKAGKSVTAAGTDRFPQCKHTKLATKVSNTPTAKTPTDNSQ